MPKPVSPIRLLIGGDVDARLDAEIQLASGVGSRTFGALAEVFRTADFALVNLESPLVNDATPAPKIGPHLRGDPRCAAGLMQAGIHALNLSNNHIMDYGWPGLASTLAACEQAGLETFGAGRNLKEADRWLVKELRGLRVAFAGLSDREWSFAGPGHAGGAPLDPIRFTRLITQRRGSFDFLVVLVHGGTEHHPLPSPRFQDTCRFLVEQGADAVICQHSHIAGACEWHRERPIVYGQGNLLAPRRRPTSRAWHLGFLVRLEFAPSSRRVSLERIPFMQHWDCAGVRTLRPDEEAEFSAEMRRLDEQITDPTAVEAAWQEHCRRQTRSYLSHVRGYTGWWRRIHNRLPFVERLLSAERKRLWLQMLRCEAHREALETVLESACDWPHAGTIAPEPQVLRTRACQDAS